jgi:hypothetical protein
MLDRLDDVVFMAAAGNEINIVPDGCMIYQPSRERVHYLNPTALVVYELSTSGAALGNIEAFLKASYALPNSPTADVRSCLEMLLNEGLIVPCPPSSPSAP